MFHKIRVGCTLFALLAALCATPAHLFAQATAPDTAVDAAETDATTDNAEPFTITLGEGMMAQVAAAAGPKEATQEMGKAVPNPAAGAQQTDNKFFSFLPVISGTGGADSPVDAAATNASWRTIKNETFEGAFPNPGWAVGDCNGAANGEYYWDDESFKYYGGHWGAWPAKGGANGVDPAFYYYPNNACSVMIYGPFSLQGARSARLGFKYWSKTELRYDWFSWVASCDGQNFAGFRISGDSRGWKNGKLDLSKLPTLGSCLGDSTVWIAFVFTSDATIVSDGPFVDNVKLEYK
ncbi:MAG: hypothetical protein U0350_25075 [Caldilineaceae bacterium]